MENEKAIVKKETPPSFIEKLMLNSESLEQVKEVGAIIIKSGFCPEHFKTSNDAVGVVMCIEAGRQLGLTWMQSLSDLYPVKGRIGMMGSAARSLIFSSGVLDKWEELTEGVYPEDTYKHVIISKRKGLPGEFRSEFSVYDAKKAGLFGKDIYQRYGKRMIMWRNIGFHATDYYGDVMKGMKTVEELNDFDVIPGVGDTTIEQPDGTKINIQGGLKGKSTKMTDRVADKIPDNKFGEVHKDNIQDAVVVEPEKKESADESPFKSEKGSKEFFDGKEIIRDEKGNIVNQEQKPEVPGQDTTEELDKKETKDLLKIVMDDMDMMEAAEEIPGKNTKKKLVEIITAHQNNKLAELVAPYMKAKKEAEKQGAGEVTEKNAGAGIRPNKEFDKERADREADEFINGPSKKVEAGNKYSIEVPEFDKGSQREFSTTKTLFNKMMGVTPQITTPRYMELAQKLGLLVKYADKEAFVKFASVAEINTLLNTN